MEKIFYGIALVVFWGGCVLVGWHAARTLPGLIALFFITFVALIIMDQRR